ncbi:DNA polymerase/primase [Mycobacterium phage Saguaro]|uniref:DNA primase/polymerase n=1 Tax=Mycobacterium phage Saguaro TaxID=2315616 RepID=A0A386KCW2_9CAUD|nr:DNA polymerase/primase [Mycobacterium phage Saguaro]AYD82050.1 DNA primase/polymerase [Mycobacterium phage Saguaro]
MLGSAPLEAVLGSGVDNTDHEAVRSFVRQAADIGLSLLFIHPGSKVPADMRTPAKRRADDKAAQEQARDAGRRDWANVKSPAGLALATSDKATLERYLKRYIEVFSTWVERAPDGEWTVETAYSKKRADAGEIQIGTPAAVNLAVEVGASGLVVIDCDTAAQMRRWFEANELDPDADDLPAPTVLTPGQQDANGTWHHSDGGHFYFTVPDELLPVLPRHIGAMTWGGDHGFAVLWDRRYVLIPPSTRPEGRYEQLGHVYPLPGWLADKILEAGQRRVDRAVQADGRVEGENSELSNHIDAWAEQVSWASILEPMGWAPAPRADSCGCAVWSAPGPHASPKSATAHDTGCAAGRYTETNAPLHLWTDHDAPPFTDHMDDPAWTPTFSKLQAVALINYGGNVGKAMDDLGITPDHTVEVGLDPRGTDADLDKSGDGSFELPADTAADPGHDTFAGKTFCEVCNTADGVFAADDDGTLWHANDEDEAADTGGHRADGTLTAPQTGDPLPAEHQPSRADMLAGLDDLVPAKVEPTDSPYPDEVANADPDVFDSKHTGVPRIAPFSHWRDMPPPEYIIDGLIEHGGLSSVIGAPGIGKSTVALDMACHIATGKRWQGRRTLKTRVLYLPGEGLAGAVQRLRAWEAEHNIDLGDDLLLGNGIILVNAVNEAWGEIAAYISRQGIGLVIFDTFARMSAGLEENSATDVGRAVRRFDKLKELTNAGVCVVHHTGKHTPEVARGSSALNGALDSELLVRDATWDTQQIADADGRLPGKPIELWTSKQKNCEQLDDAIPLLMRQASGIDAPLITGPNGDVDPMQGEIVLARPLPEPIVETAIRVRQFVDRLPQQGATRAELVVGVRPDSYAASRNDTGPYWKQRIAEAVDTALRFNLIETLTGTPSGARYIPSTATAEDARARAAAEVNGGD